MWIGWKEGRREDMEGSGIYVCVYGGDYRLPVRGGGRILGRGWWRTRVKWKTPGLGPNRSEYRCIRQMGLWERQGRRFQRQGQGRWRAQLGDYQSGEGAGEGTWWGGDRWVHLCVHPCRGTQACLRYWQGSGTVQGGICLLKGCHW